MRVRIPLAALALWAAAQGAASAASPQVGDPFPALVGKEFVNTPEVDAKNLRGRLVLCEIFSTT